MNSKLKSIKEDNRPVKGLNLVPVEALVIDNYQAVSLDQVKGGSLTGEATIKVNTVNK